ncbi:hypothetical protein BKA70DRAFT_121262 [Coprinopsis sp. MPI-PUGE-AT-0042]|nr:hypothetical protein BKA70DRAFT_121262 [Coprinopsis sp. MPI-PUGE-AT-0042]
MLSSITSESFAAIFSGSRTSCMSLLSRSVSTVDTPLIRVSHRWSWGSYSANQPVAIQALQPILPSLRQVELLAFQGDHMLLLSSLPPLTRLVIDDLYYNSEVGDLVWKETTRLVARSRDTLQELRLSVWPQRCDNRTPSIQDILPRSTSFPKLKSLSLNANLATRSTSMALPQISSLQSLSLSGGVNRGAWPQEQDNTFVALRQSRIHLRQVTAPESPPLLDYLASYESVLERIQIEDSGQRDTELTVPRTTLASRFFREVIPRHRSSLKEIGIDTDYDEGWAFGDSESNASMFVDPLPMLESLNMPILMNGMTANHLVSVF